MKSFQAENNSRYTQKDTKIPSGEIPYIILHWLHEHYYGGGLTPLDLRKYLESKLRQGVYEQDVVAVWIKRAHYWEQAMEKAIPGRVDALLAEYFTLRIAA